MLKTLQITAVVSMIGFTMMNPDQVGEFLAKYDGVSVAQKLALARSIIQSSSEPIEVNGKVVHINSDEVDLLELYRLAQIEAHKMVLTGDFSAYQDQLDNNKEFLDLLNRVGASSGSVENPKKR